MNRVRGQRCTSVKMNTMSNALFKFWNCKESTPFSKQCKRRSAIFKLRDREILVLPEQVNWTDQTDGQIRSRRSHLPCHKEGVVRYSQIRTKKRKTDACTRTGRNADHPDFRAGFQERNEVSAADLSAPPNIPEAKWQQQQQSQQQQGSRVRFEGHPETDRAGRGS